MLYCNIAFRSINVLVIIKTKIWKKKKLLCLRLQIFPGYLLASMIIFNFAQSIKGAMQSYC